MIYTESIFNVKTSSQILRQPTNQRLTSRQPNGDCSKSQAQSLEMTAFRRSMMEGYDGKGSEKIIDKMDCQVLPLSCGCRSICILSTLSIDERALVQYRFRFAVNQNLTLCEFTISELKAVKQKLQTFNKLTANTQREKISCFGKSQLNENGIFEVKAVIPENLQKRLNCLENRKYSVKYQKTAESLSDRQETIKKQYIIKKHNSNLAVKIDSTEKPLSGIKEMIRRLYEYEYRAETSKGKEKRNFLKLAKRIKDLLA